MSTTRRRLLALAFAAPLIAGAVVALPDDCLTNPQVQDFSVVLAGLGGAQLTPEEVAACEQSYTGQYLRKMLR